MKVYVVEYDDDVWNEVMGVFDSKEKAEAFVVDKYNRDWAGEKEICSSKVYVKPVKVYPAVSSFTEIQDFFYSITEYNVV